MSSVILAGFFLMFQFSGLCVELVVKECLNKVCKNVNLSDSVVILRPEQSQGKTLIHFKDSITDSNL